MTTENSFLICPRKWALTFHVNHLLQRVRVLIKYKALFTYHWVELRFNIPVMSKHFYPTWEKWQIQVLSKITSSSTKEARQLNYFTNPEGGVQIIPNYCLLISKFGTSTLSTLGKIFSRWHIEIFFLFFPENRFWHFEISNPFFFRKNKKNINLLAAELAQKVVKVNGYDKKVACNKNFFFHIQAICSWTAVQQNIPRG